MYSTTQRIWGYETRDGSFAQFARVQAQQLMPRPQHLTWEESACYTLTLATAYRMLFGHRPAHPQARPQRPGLGRLRAVWALMAIQLINTAGANAIGVISRGRQARRSSCRWAPRASSTAGSSTAGANCPMFRIPTVLCRLVCRGAAKFGKAIWAFTGKGNDVDFVFEHPRRGDLPGLLFRRQARRHGGLLRRHDPATTSPSTPDSCGCARSASRAATSANLMQASQANKAGDRTPRRSLHVGSPSRGRTSPAPT